MLTVVLLCVGICSRPFRVASTCGVKIFYNTGLLWPFFFVPGLWLAKHKEPFYTTHFVAPHSGRFLLYRLLMY